MDVETVLATFKVPGAIDSRAALDDAVFNLLGALDTADADVVSLLTSLIQCSDGLLETVLTSRNNDGFAFRSRILKSLQKSSSTPNPIFQKCAQRLGFFLVGLPPWIKLDRLVMETYNAFSATSEISESPKVEPNHSKKEKSASKFQAKSGKRKQRFVPLHLALETSPSEADDQVEEIPETPVSPKQPPSPTTPLNPRSVNPLDHLRECLETYFTACVEEAVEEFAINSLFAALSQNVGLHSQPSSPVALKQQAPSSPVAERVPIESPTRSRFKPQPHPSLEPNDISRYLEDAASSKFGDWPVVVSQRGIKHLRQYIASDKEVFGQIEKKIKRERNNMLSHRQLSVGYFSLPNHTKLLDQDFGIPIYTADLGGDLRLICHVDFGAPTGTNDESQCPSDSLTF
ncbi:hypothetical protein FRC01_002610 [Tulasnella sp. 417]|nr:hypothetical protein FRC01_002610 [Tulasnella sp. 417]